MSTDKTPALNFNCSPEIKAKVRARAEAEFRTMSNWVTAHATRILMLQDEAPEKPVTGVGTTIIIRQNGCRLRPLVVQKADEWGWSMTEVLAWAIQEALA